MEVGFVDAGVVKRMLQDHQGKIKPEIDKIDGKLYDTLLGKDFYTKEDVQFLSNNFIKGWYITPLLYIDMHKWHEIDPSIIDAIYKHLHEIKEGLQKIKSEKWLSGFHEPRYRLATVLHNRNSRKPQQYEAILPDTYKYLPMSIQEDIYTYLESNHQTKKLEWIPSMYQPQYATICALLHIKMS
jgi:hypothetical protein